MVGARFAAHIQAMHTPHRLLPLFALLSACASTHPAFRFEDSPADFNRLGLTETVEVREDGRRTIAGSGDYEWWYLDGIAQDGTVVVIVFSDNWLPGTGTREVSIEVTPPGRPTRRESFVSDQPGSFSLERADVRIGASRFEGDLAHYRIHVDPSEAHGLGCDLTLERRVPSYRPGTGVFGSGDDFFAWVVPVPEGALTGTLRVDGREVAFSGSGYHDHNWGNVGPNELMRNWWWGRAEVDGRTVVMAELRPAKGRGEQNLPLLYVAGPEGVAIEAHSDAVRLTEDAPRPDEDPLHDEARAGGVTLTTSGGTSVHFVRHDAPIASFSLLKDRSAFVRFLAGLSGKSPWYTRWQSTVTLGQAGRSTQGKGTVEFIDFE
jgi:hypothetical protein